jgi:HK97 family phage major capsid protein
MKKILELKQKRSQLKVEGRALATEGKTEDAAAKLAEVRALDTQIEQLEQFGEEEEERSLDTNLEERGFKRVDGGSTEETPEQRAAKTEEEYRSAFYKKMAGQELTLEESRSLKVGTATAGGYTVPKSFQKKLIDKLEELNVMRQLATVIQTDSDTDIPVVVNHGTAEWTAEEADFNESDDTFGILTIKAYKLTRIVKVSEELLQDSAFDIENYLVNEFARSMAKAEEKAFVNGDGVGKPKGVLVDAQVGVTTASGTTITADEIIDLFYSLRRPYRSGAAWLMDDTTVKAIRKMKDSEGNYLWEKGFGNAPETILGRPVYTTEFMPDIALGAKVMAFGDFSYYEIADRKSRVFQRLNERYAEKGQIGFRGYERVDGLLTQAETVKVLQMKSS